MRVEVLGCCGGIGRDMRTTSLLVDRDILIDAGTGVGDLTLEALGMIDHVFVTHAHLDHICMIPFMLDTVSSLRTRPLLLYATDETWQAMHQHIFNWKIWPDFTAIPSPEAPLLRHVPIRPFETVTLDDRKITPLPADHVVPAVGYLLESPDTSLAFSGDTADCPAFWEAIARIDNLRHLIVEVACDDTEIALAEASKHMRPAQLMAALSRLPHDVSVYVTHLKPHMAERIMRQLDIHAAGRCVPAVLQRSQLIDF